MRFNRDYYNYTQVLDPGGPTTLLLLASKGVD